MGRYRHGGFDVDRLRTDAGGRARCFGAVVCLSAALWCAPFSAAENALDGPGVSEDEFAVAVQPFFDAYCVQCHGENKQKGKRRFDAFSASIRDDGDLVDYQDILDQLNLDEMPPEDEKQPGVEEQLQLIAWLTDRIGRFHLSNKASSGRAVLRRLNSREYRNTIRDLLHLNTTIFDPTAGFPRDQVSEHLDTVGDTLVTSGFLLQRYLDAADQSVRKAMGTVEKPPVQTWVFRDGFHQQPEIDQVHRTFNKYEWMTLYEVVGADKHEGAYGPIHAFAEGVPYDGYYEISFKAEALNRINPYDAKLLGNDPSELFRLGVVPGDHTVSRLHTPQPVEPLLTEIELADGTGHYTVRVWLDAGYTPRFTFRNGPIDVRTLYGRLVKTYPDLFPEPRRKGIVENRYLSLAKGKMPQIRIDDIEIKGPFHDAWPTAGQRAVLGAGWEQLQATGAMTEEQMRASLEAFASRAYRRPVRPDELDRLMGVVRGRREAGRAPLDAYADGVKAVLCSPNFLYLAQPGEEGTPSYALASRLSYFLWASMPDEELLDLARSDALLDPDVLEKQLDRMLDDKRSDAFIEGFLGSWLTLRDLGATSPDRRAFQPFYAGDLDRAMREETRLYARSLIDSNLDIVNFLDSDFTYVNRPLARLYGLKLPEGSGFERVDLTDKRRGGLLGQASVLTVTANGVDTSPVLRGVWLLENILGTPPSPPPPDVEPLDPDIRGAKTIRDQLTKHRESPTCYECHKKIDPLGFALENFDPIGGWRDTYDRGAPVDAAGELPGGKRFDDIVGLKAILIERRDQFALSLTKKLLAYATGRRLAPGDRPHLDRILEDLDEKGNGFRDLLRLIVVSEPFRMN